MMVEQVVTGGNMNATHQWDAGDAGCGTLVMELYRRVRQLQPGECIEVTAHSPGAPVDIPAWCRMTGHTLVKTEPPVYLIERRHD